MIVEFLTFTVPADERDDWLRIAEHRSRLLERQTGFVRKQIWASLDDSTQVQSVIWWESIDDWKSIPADALQQVVAAIGPHERTATCEAFELLRDS
jgi:uncharacterized protein (TIGR03792 family)